MDELDRLGWAVRRSYRFGNSYLGIRTNSESFGAWLDQTLAGHRSRKKPDYFHYSVLLANGSPKAAGRRFHILYRETLMVQRTFHLPTVGRTLLAELEA